MRFIPRLLFKLFGWRVVKPLGAEAEVFKLLPDCRYLALIDSRVVSEAEAMNLGRLLPPKSAVYMVDMARAPEGLTPKELVQLFRLSKS